MNFTYPSKHFCEPGMVAHVLKSLCSAGEAEGHCKSRTRLTYRASAWPAREIYWSPASKKPRMSLMWWHKPVPEHLETGRLISSPNLLINSEFQASQSNLVSLYLKNNIKQQKWKNPREAGLSAFLLDGDLSRSMLFPVLWTFSLFLKLPFLPHDWLQA